MNKKLVIMAGILIALAAFAFVAPLGLLKANMETTACPDSLCIINNANKAPGGVHVIDIHWCNLNPKTCTDCCAECDNYDHTVGVCGNCNDASTYDYQCPV
jgi:hypothetical protein